MRCRRRRHRKSHFPSAIVRAERLEPRRLLSTVTFVGKGDGVSWTDPNNWSAGQLPQAADDVVINFQSGVVIQLASGTQSVHSVSTTNAINITGGTLQVATTLDESGPFAQVRLNGGTLQDADVTGNENFTDDVQLNTGTLSHVTLDVTAQVSNASGAVMTVANGLTLNSTLTVGVQGEFQLGATGELAFQGTQTVGGKGTIHLLATSGTTLDVNPGVINIGIRPIFVPSTVTFGPGLTVDGVGLIRDNFGRDTLVNQGIIQADQIFQQGTVLQVSVQNFTNSGITRETPGSALAITAGPNGTGTLSFTNQNAVISGQVVAGTIAVSGGTVTINSPNPVSLATLNVSGGTVLGSAELDITGTASAWSGGVIGGTGLLDLKPGAALATSGSAVSVTRPFDNDGAVNVNGGALNLLGNGIHNGAFNIANGATLTFGGASSDQSFNNASAILGAGNVVFSGRNAFITGAFNIGSTRVTAADSVQFEGQSPTTGTLTQDGGQITIGFFLIPAPRRAATPSTAPATNCLHVLHQHIISNGVTTVLPDWCLNDDGNGLQMLPSASGIPSIVLTPDGVNPGELMFSGTGGVTCTGNGGGSITSSVPAGLLRGYIDLNGAKSFTIGSAGASLTVSASLGDGSVRSDGPGSLKLAAPNTYAGGTTIASSAAGHLEIDDPAALGPGPVTFAGGDLVIGTSGNLALHNAFAPDAPADGIRINVGSVNLSLDGLTAGSFLGVSGTSGSLTANGPVTLQTDLTISNPVNVTLSGQISGASGLAKTGGGALTLTGATGNAYTGATKVLEGALVLQKGGGFAVPGELSIAPDLAAGAAVRLRAANQLPPSTIVQFDSTTGPAVLDVTGATQSLAGLDSTLKKFGSLLVGAVGKLSLTGSSSTLHDLNLVGGGKLDIGTGALSLAYGSGVSPLASIRLFLSLGEITAGPLAVAYTDASEGVVTTLPANTVLIKGTVAGDVNMDGTVGFNDLLLMAQHFGGTNATWVKGDVDYNGQVAFGDLLILAQHYGQARVAAVDAAARARRTR